MTLFEACSGGQAPVLRPIIRAVVRALPLIVIFRWVACVDALKGRAITAGCAYWRFSVGR